MKSLLTFSLALVIFTCAMRYWQYDFGAARLSAANILALVFDFFAIIYIFEARVPKIPKGFPSKFTLFYIIFFAIAVASVILVDWELDGAPEQYYKNIMFHLALTSFMCLAALGLVELKASGASKLLKFYLLTAAFSGLWCVVEVVLATHGISLNELTFGSISTYKEDMLFLYEWDFFFRATGFAGVNAEATYLVSVIPILLIWQPFKPRVLNSLLLVLCLTGLTLTMSKNGFLALGSSLLFLSFFRPKLLGARFRVMIISLIPLTIMANYFWNDISSLFFTRVSVDGADSASALSGRSEIILATFKAILDRPLGYGIGQYVVHLSHTDAIDIGSLVRLFGTSSEEIKVAYSNPHNNWITWMFEYGLVGGALYMYFYGWLIYAMLRMNTELSGAIAASIFGLVVAAIFNSTLDQFSVQVFIVVAAITAYCDAYERYILNANPSSLERRGPFIGPQYRPILRAKLDGESVKQSVNSQ